jgi:hypothetical protein
MKYIHLIIYTLLSTYLFYVSYDIDLYLHTIVLVSMFFLGSFATGIIHFIFDNYFSEQTFLIGHIVKEFRFHHTDPEKIAREDNVDAIKNAIIPANITLLLFLLLNHFIKINNILLMSFIYFSSFAVLTNLVHRQNHLKPNIERPLWYTIFNKVKIFQSSEEHNIHHTPPYTKSFFILNDFFNPLFNKLKIWEKSAQVIKKITGIKAVDF